MPKIYFPPNHNLIGENISLGSHQWGATPYPIEKHGTGVSSLWGVWIRDNVGGPGQKGGVLKHTFWKEPKN